MPDRITLPDWTRRDFLKASAIAAGGLATADLLAACGQAATPPAHVTLNVLLANHTPYYKMITPTFQQNNNATVNFTREQFGLLPAKLATAFSSGGYTWDVVYLWRAWVEQFRKYLTPLDELGFTPDTSDMLPVSLKQIKATADMKALLPYMPKEVVTSPWGIYDVEAKKVFFAQKAGMIIDYQHIWYEAIDPSVATLSEGDLQVAIIPGKSGGPKSGGQFVGECFAIPKTAKDKQRALALAKYYSNAQNQLGLITKRSALHSFDPAGEDGFPAYKSDYTASSISGRDKTQVDVVFQQQQEKGDRYETRPAYQKIADTIEAAVSSVLTGQKGVSQAHASGQSALDQVVNDEKAGKF